VLAVWSWLRELIEVDGELTVERAADVLTGAGIEVEGIDAKGDGFSGVVVAEVVAKKPHPNADKLTLVDVIDADGGTATQVVCGAPNVPEPGGRVLWARPGAVLPGGFAISTRAIKGVDSPGMLCAEDELGLGDDHGGIIILSGDEAAAPLGATAQAALGLDDYVLDVNAPANRPDTLGHYGIARELAALIGAKVLPVAADLSSVTDSSASASELVTITIDDPVGCPRYVGRVINGLTVGPSPRWLRQRLDWVGVRPLSNLVDVTNYVLFELGQPLHAFDYDKVRGQHIDVRRAKPGERMTTLDTIDRPLEPTDLLICDGEGPVALAGVMGGLESEVTDPTTRVLLESASFHPGSIRRTARRLGLHSEASYRFERDVDPNLNDLASARACALFAQVGGGTVAPGMVDVYPTPRDKVTVAMRASRATQLTGLEFTREHSAELLSRLGLEVDDGQGDELSVSCPTHRPDLTREVDLIEEVMRLHGIDKVPATLPNTDAATGSPTELVSQIARRALVAAGLSEAITYGFTSPDRTKAMGFADDDRRSKPIAIRNPMTVEQSVMRTSLYPNLLKAVARNISYDVADAALFEIGCVFLPRTDSELADEPIHVAGVLTGRRPRWLKEGGKAVDFYDAKGAVERLLAELAPTGTVSFASTTDIGHLHPGLAATVSVDGKKVGEIGEIHPSIRGSFDIEVPVFGFDVDTTEIGAPEPAQMLGIPKYPAITRDISFFVSEATPASRVAELIGASSEPLVENALVLEEYKHAQKVPQGQKGMLWTITYRSGERTLTDKEVDAAHEAIVDTLLQKLPADRR
jgi:phenylalanyl-tRNA synthetase beta chain